MKNIAKSACTFVGLHPLESFTITSLESLSRGVPLIVKPHKKLETHPALEMVEPEFRKYIYMYKDKADFEYAVNMKMNRRINPRDLDSKFEISS